MAKGKSWYRLASTAFFAIACIAGIIWCAMLLRSYAAYASISASLGDSGLLGSVTSSFMLGSEIAVLAGGIIWGVVAAVMALAAWRAWKTKWGKKQSTVFLGLIVLVAVWLVGGLSYWGIWYF